MSSGVAAVEGKEGAEDFSLKYDWLKGQIEENPEATEFKLDKPSICTLTNTLKTNTNEDGIRVIEVDESKFKSLGEVEVITKTINIKVDDKRSYWDTPQKAGDLLEKHYESEPMDMAVIMGQGVS